MRRLKTPKGVADVVALLSGRRGKHESGQSRWALAMVIVMVLAMTMTMMFTPRAATAQSDEFEVTIPISTVVKASEGSVTILATQSVAEEGQGRLCSVTARSENQESAHPDNDLVVTSNDSQVTLADVEREPGAVTVAEGTVQLGADIVVSLIMGPDGIFSAGITVFIECPQPPPETTTTTESTTTTKDEVLSTEVTTTTEATTATTEEQTTSTVADEVLPTKVTNTTVGDEVAAETLPFTGWEDQGIAMVGLAVISAGVLVLVAARQED